MQTKMTHVDAFANIVIISSYPVEPYIMTKTLLGFEILCVLAIQSGWLTDSIC